MIRINLQTEYQSYGRIENLISQLILFGIALFLILGCLQYYNSILQSDIHLLENKSSQTQAKINRYKKKLRQIKQLKINLNTIEKKLNVIKQLSFSRYNAIYLLDSITEAVIPKRMWFSSIDFRDAKVKIEGLAMDERTVTDFMKRLEDAQKWICISDDLINNLKTKNIPEPILLKMSDIKDFQFFEDQEFEFMLDAILGDQLTEKDKETIMNLAVLSYFSEVKLISTAKQTVKKDTHLTRFIIDCSQNTL